MKHSILSLVANTELTILTSRSLVYKTEKFISKTKDVSNIDILLTKLCETILLNLEEITEQEGLLDKSCFTMATADKQYTFSFLFGYQISNNFNKYDIILIDAICNNKQSNLIIDEYVNAFKLIKFTLRKDWCNCNKKDLVKLYLLSNVSGINLPKLSQEQKEVVEGLDKNILVQGVAGSGKTNICIDKIIYTACRNFSGKTLYTTFNRGLLVDTKLKIEDYKKDLNNILTAYKNKKIKFLDNNHKKALENKLGITFFSDDDNLIFNKIERVLDYLQNKVDYVLIEDLYYSKIRNCDFVNQDYFIKSYLKNITNHQIEKTLSKLSNHSSEVIYKEIYGFLLGSYDINNHLDILSLDDYIERRKNSFSKQECEMIYQIALDYMKHCNRLGLVDNNSASKELIKTIKDFEYSLVIIDEVQDYTQCNLCLFRKLGLKLFCVGDALQMINPAYFSFGYLKNLLYEKDLIDVKELKSNYRNTERIVEIIDNLEEINKQEFGTHNFVVKGKSVDSGLKTTALFVRDINFIKSISNSGYEDLTIVVANEKIKKQVTNIIKSQEVLTVSEIKGLERTNVLVYNLLSSNIDKWNTLKRNKVNHKDADENSVYRYYYNLFYVGLSRAKQNIIVCEDLSIEQFETFFSKNFNRCNLKEAMNILDKIISKAEFSQSELLARTKEFIRLGQWDNARFIVSKIKDDRQRIEAGRHIDISSQYISKGNYREAGIKYWEYGMLEDAKKQFTLSKDTILIELVDICSKSSNKDLNIDIVEYFEDVKENRIAQAFIVDTVKKDIANLKQGFSKIHNNFKKGRK